MVEKFGCHWKVCKLLVKKKMFLIWQHCLTVAMILPCATFITGSPNHTYTLTPMIAPCTMLPPIPSPPCTLIPARLTPHIPAWIPTHCHSSYFPGLWSCSGHADSFSVLPRASQSYLYSRWTQSSHGNDCDTAAATLGWVKMGRRDTKLHSRLDTKCCCSSQSIQGHHLILFWKQCQSFKQAQCFLVFYGWLHFFMNFTDRHF